MIPGDFRIPDRPSNKRMVLLGFTGVVSLAVLVGVVLGITYVLSAWLGRPVVFAYEEGPTQPIAFPHTVHAGSDVLLDQSGNPRLDSNGQQMTGLGLDCTFCHRNVAKEAAASIPAVDFCMSCHKTVGDDNQEIAKLRDIYSQGQPINWLRVHRVPDHVHFVHEAHIRYFSEKEGKAPSEVCSTCHGDVKSMSVVTQVEDLKMKDCVDCHRDNGAPTDCTTCHY